MRTRCFTKWTVMASSSSGGPRPPPRAPPTGSLAAATRLGRGGDLELGDRADGGAARGLAVLENEVRELESPLEHRLDCVAPRHGHSSLVIRHSSFVIRHSSACLNGYDMRNLDSHKGAKA